tara:strand:- start:7 stop:474 length:468 start_codon:yes stop_codon:yes gene_type:complete
MSIINNREILNNLFYSFGSCLQNSIINKKTLKDKYGIETTIKVGSLGFGLKDNVFYEYGYLNEKKFEKNYKKDNGLFDLHFWLEDTNGNIIDCFYYEYNSICRINNVKCLFKQYSLIRNKKELLKRMGIHYLELNNKKLGKKIIKEVTYTVYKRI